MFYSIFCIEFVVENEQVPGKLTLILKNSILGNVFSSRDVVNKNCTQEGFEK